MKVRERDLVGRTSIDVRNGGIEESPETSSRWKSRPVRNLQEKFYYQKRKGDRDERKRITIKEGREHSGR